MSAHASIASLRALAAFACACALLGGCEDVAPSEPELSCDLPNTGRVLDGLWTLSGSGRREDCEDRRLEGDLSIHTSMPIAIEAAAQATGGPASGPEPSSEADAFVDRIERADFALALGDDAPDDFTISGEVAGSCVHFVLTEDLGSDALVYEFDGYITGSSFAEGTFQGTGPEECKVSGEFELHVR